MKSGSRHTIPAFTLWELMIAMLITSLIVALSYGAYWKFTSILQSESAEAEEMHSLRLLERKLFQLTQECEQITLEGDALIFDFPQVAFYLEFSDSTMILTEEGVFGDEYRIEAWNAGYLNNQTEHIDRFQIRYMAGKRGFQLSFKKTYSKLYLYTLNHP